ncbi:MAG: Crp/Fnr family transcriptional regulator, partial [Clostridium sp.]|nr:Crp/Fnr family transcriptional regulator [Clostridium sp.]
MNQVPSAAVQMPHANFVSRLLYLPRGISRLEKLGQKKSFPKNHMLVQAGTRTNYCYIVKKGRVAAFETTVTGEERIYNFNESNSLVLEGNLLFDQESPVNFKTVQPSELVCITKEMLLEGIAGDPQLAMDIMESLSTKFLSAMEQVRHTNFHNAGWKICDLL